MACLDTTILIDLMRGRRNPRLQRAWDMIEWLLAKGEELATTRFSIAELWVGHGRSDDPAAEEERIRRVLQGLQILEFTSPCEETFGRILGRISRLGQSIGDMDALIASVALCSGHAVVTRNVKDFKVVPDLQVFGYDALV